MLRESVGMSMAAVPANIDPSKVRDFLASRSGVASLHDLHIWPMGTTEVALTCHMVMPAGHPGDEFLRHLADDLRTRFKISHPTVQIEIDLVGCMLAPDDTI